MKVLHNLNLELHSDQLLVSCFGYCYSQQLTSTQKQLKKTMSMVDLTCPLHWMLYRTHALNPKSSLTGCRKLKIFSGGKPTDLDVLLGQYLANEVECEPNIGQQTE